MLRLLVPLGLLIMGVGVIVAVFKNTGRQGSTPPATTPATTPTNPLPTTPAPPAAQAPGTPASTPPTNQATAAPAANPQAPSPSSPAASAVSLDGLQPMLQPETSFTPIGSLDASSPLEMRVEFSTIGAGVKAISLTHHFETIAKKQHIVIQSEHTYQAPMADARPETITPFAGLQLDINGAPVALLFAMDPSGKAVPLWRETAPGVFEAIIVNSKQEQIARIERKYSLVPGSFTLQLAQSVTNLTGVPLTFRWHQFGPIDLPGDAGGYGGDKRRVRFGYLTSPEAQRSDPTVLSNEFQHSRSTIVGRTNKSGVADELLPVWPNPTSTRDKLRLVWLGLTNRYFGAAMLPIVPANSGPDAKVFRAAEAVDRVLMHQWDADRKYQPALILKTASQTTQVAAGASADFSMGVYAGPLERPRIRSDAATGPVGLDGIVLYTFGGMCGPCTFSFLTSWLLGLLRFLHANIVFDWALSIMVLVLIVRTILHPVTKWSQIRLQRFGKQMQGMAPKQKKIQEKYKDDPRKMKEEMAKLWREEGVNPAGALGCIPMFLQMPVWIALYATLYFAFELRHQPAFFGVFQSLVPGQPRFLGWFLGDLAEPDRFFYFNHDIHVWGLSGFIGPIHSLNILPFILGVVFFIQQKYLSPPSTGNMTPEQESQQKMVKVMMVVLFPVMMYNAPSGLAIYFIVNSTLGILESRYIRRHIDKNDLLKPTQRKGPKPGGFLDRLHKLAEERQRQMAKSRGQQPPRKKV